MKQYLFLFLFLLSVYCNTSKPIFQHTTVLFDSYQFIILNAQGQVEFLQQQVPNFPALTTNSVVRPLVPNEIIVSIQHNRCVTTASHKLYCWDYELEQWYRGDVGLPFENSIQFWTSSGVVQDTNGTIYYRDQTEGTYKILPIPSHQIVKLFKMYRQIYVLTQEKQIYSFEENVLECISCNWTISSTIADISEDGTYAILQEGTMCTFSREGCSSTSGFRKYKFSHFIPGGAVTKDNSIMLIEKSSIVFSPYQFDDTLVNIIPIIRVDGESIVFQTASGTVYVMGYNKKSILADNSDIDKPYPINLLQYRSTIFHLRIWNIILSVVVFAVCLLLVIGVVVLSCVSKHYSTGVIQSTVIVVPIVPWFISDLLSKIVVKTEGVAYGKLLGDWLFGWEFSILGLVGLVHCVSFGIIIISMFIGFCEVIYFNIGTGDSYDRKRFTASLIGIVACLFGLFCYYTARIFNYWLPITFFQNYFPIFSTILSSVGYLSFLILLICFWVGMLFWAEVFEKHTVIEKIRMLIDRNKVQRL